MLRFHLASRLPSTLSKEDVAHVARQMTKALHLKRTNVIYVTFATERAMQEVNKRTRGNAHATDVLSFATAEEMRRVTPRDTEVDLGEIMICATYAAKEARRRSIDVREELMRLLIHGVLHIQGYDHAKEKEEAKMFALQERLVAEIVESDV